MTVIYFQGVEGSYSHQALHHFLDQTKLNLKEPIQLKGCLLSEDVLDSTARPSLSFGFLPVENSIVGSVIHNSELIFSNDVNLVAELYFPIQHCLLVQPGVSLEQVTEVRSHPIALAQCHDFIRQKSLTPISHDDTAKAAQELAETQQKHVAVIASSLCAKLYDLSILSRDIQKVQNNYTRFFLFHHRQNSFKSNQQHDKITVVFQTHHRPGALLEILNILAEYRFNLTKLESRPDPNNPFTYFFTADIIANLEDHKTQSMLKDLEEKALMLKVLGGYQQAFIPKS